MNIWRTQPLVDALRAGPLPEQEQFKYYAAFVMLAVLGWSMPIDSDAKGWLGTYGIVRWAVYAIITILGLLYIFSVNRRHGDTNFVGRVVALSLPVTVQLLLLICLTLVFAAIVPDLLPDRPNQS